MRSINLFGLKCNSNKQIRRNKFPMASVVFISIITLISIIAPIFIKESQNYISLSRTYIVPSTSSQYLFGTDSMGRNILIRCIYGGRVSILVGFTCMISSSVIGIIYGCISGYYGGKLDKFLMRMLDFFLILPTIIIAAFVQSFFQEKGILEVILVISLTGWMRVARIVRGEVVRLKHYEFLIASKTLGGDFGHIMIKHLIPNFMPAIIYICSLNIAYAIITESTLSFLGLGLPVEVSSWGSMLIEGQKDILSNKWWTSFFPGILIIITVFSVTNIGEYVRKRNNKNFVSV